MRGTCVGVVYTALMWGARASIQAVVWFSPLPGQGVGRVHEKVLEDGGGVVAREVVNYRLHEVGGDGEEASPCALVALPGPNRGEVLARPGGAASNNTRHSLFGSASWMVAATFLGSSLLMSPVWASHGSFAAVTLRQSWSI